MAAGAAAAAAARACGSAEEQECARCGGDLRGADGCAF